MATRIRYVILLTLLVVIGFLYAYQHTMFMRPFGQHIWRQCDGASFMWTYTHTNMNFFEARTNNIFAADGKMMPEFPIVYYTAACLNKLISYHEGWIRFIHFLLFIAGIFALSKITFHFTKNQVLAVLLPLLLYSSPMIIFYSNGFLPDVAAIAASLIGLSFFLDSRMKPSKANMLFSILFFTLAGLLKPTALNVFFALAILYFIEQVLKFRISKKTFFKKQDIWFFLMVIGLNVLWILFAIAYNKSNNSIYMQAFIKPMWVPAEFPIAETFGHIQTEWIKLFTGFPLLYFVIVVAVLALYTRRSDEWWLPIFMCSMLLVLSINTLFFYHQFYHHGYYLIVFMPLVLCFLVLSYAKFQTYTSKWMRVIRVLFLLSLVLFINMNMHKTIKYIYRMQYHFPENAAFDRYKDITPLLRAKHITTDDKVLCWGDRTSSVSLYLLGQRGWTDYYRPSIEIPDLKKVGIKYLVTNVDAHADDPCLLPLKNKLVLSHNGIDVYQIW